MKKRIIATVALMLLLICLASCRTYASKYEPSWEVEEEKWVCQEVDMYFYMARPYPYGELRINGETIKIITKRTCIGSPIGIYRDTELARSDESGFSDDRMFELSYCKYKNGKFTGKIFEDKYRLFEGGPRKLTFIREEY